MVNVFEQPCSPSPLTVDAFSACLRKLAPARAVDLLEQGQGVSWSQLTRLCSPLDDAIVSSLAGKTLADEFTQLALLIRNALTSHGGGGAGQHERVCCLNLKLQSVVINIHNPPGLSHFLLPSLFPYTTLFRSVMIRDKNDVISLDQKIRDS